jgi:hypothetical protein
MSPSFEYLSIRKKKKKKDIRSAVKWHFSSYIISTIEPDDKK